jgi:hypothetical protein
MMEDILRKYGVSSEGANLSGLNEEPDQKWHTIILSMAEEKEKARGAKLATAEKEKAKQRVIQGHESRLTHQQSKPATAASLAPAGKDADKPAGADTGAGAPSAKKRPLGPMERFSDAIERIVAMPMGSQGSVKERRVDETKRERATRIIREEEIYKAFLENRESRGKVVNFLKSEVNCDDFLNQFADEDRVSMLENLV